MGKGETLWDFFFQIFLKVMLNICSLTHKTFNRKSLKKRKLVFIFFFEAAESLKNGNLIILKLFVKNR